VIEAWGATNDHAGERYIQLAGNIRDMDLRQIVSSLGADAERYEGRVSAEFAGGGYLGQPDRLFGDATIVLRESDLVAAPLVSQLYGLFSAGAAEGPRGVGLAALRLDGKLLRATHVEYLSRGLEIRATLRAADIFRGGQSPITGVAVGTARPLSDTEIPLSGAADRILSAAQAGGTVARIGGTIAEPSAQIVPLSDVRAFISDLLGPLAD
jgi:hypothetical protein